MTLDRAAPSVAPPSPAEARFGISDLLRVLSEHRALVRNVTLAVMAVTILVVSAMPTLYSTSAVVMLDQRKNNVADLSSVLSALPTDPSSVQNQIQVLSSRDLALKVIAKLKLYDDPEFNAALDKSGFPSLALLNLIRKPAAPGEDRRDAIITAFLNRLDVTALGLSTSIDVGFTARDPAKAALIANTLAELYTQDQIATKIDAARQAAQWLTDRMHQLAQQVQQQESAVEEYKADHNLVDSAQGNSLVNQQLVAINAQLVQAQSDLAEKTASYERVQALIKSGNPGDVTQVVSSKMIGDLKTQEAELVRQEADLSTRYGPNHPKMVAMRTEKRNLEAKIAQEVASIGGSIASDMAVARAHVASIEASLRRVEQQARGDNQARVKLNALEADLASTRTMYESFVSRLRAVQDQDNIQIAEARVISTAPIPSSPSSPHRMLFVAASFPAGLLLGILAALLVERFQAPPPVRDIREEPPVAAAPTAPEPPAETAYELPPVLAELPATADMRVADWVLDHPTAPYSLSLSSLLGGTFPSLTGQGRIIALTSAVADPGKSVIALSLARLAARRGLRTVIVDGDTGWAGGSVLAALLQGRAVLTRALRKDSRTNAYLLAASRDGPAWALPRMSELMGYFRRACDVVIVDAAPVGTAGAWPATAKLCDKVVLVADAKAPQRAFEHALRSLVASGASVPGLVITR